MIPRPDYTHRILHYLDQPFIKILTGVRRSGKSTILEMLKQELLAQKKIQPEQIVDCRFDSMEYNDLSAKDMYQLLKSQLSSTSRTYVFLDEVQEIDGWEKVVNSLYADFSVDLFITGSNSRMMASEIATYLTGRYIRFPVYTLSFREYLAFEKTYRTTGEPAAELSRYLRTGGFPATHITALSDEEIYTVVRDIYNSTVFSDIVRRSQIRKTDLLERIVKYTFENTGNPFSAKSISAFLKSEQRRVDTETIYSYLQKLENAYLLHRCLRYDLKGKEYLRTQEKFYLADTALRFAVLGYDPNAAAAMLENIIYLELLRRGYTVFVGKIPDGEIEFVAARQNERIYVQVTQEILSPKTAEREYGRLLSIPDNYPKYVLNASPYAGGNYKGIKTMNIADFLLQKEW